jgi:ribonuclease HII
MQLRRSARLLALSSSSSYHNGRTLAVMQSKNNNDPAPNYKKKFKGATIKSSNTKAHNNRTKSSNNKINKRNDGSSSDENHPSVLLSLPRTREKELLQHQQLVGNTTAGTIHAVFGVDEAGRGPLAGPVVAAAAWVPTDILGIMDSKLISKEEERERLFHLITATSRWTCAVVDASTIDDINILQASLLAMKMASDALVQLLLLVEPTSSTASHEDKLVTSLVSSKPSAKRTGCYVFGGYCSDDNKETLSTLSASPPFFDGSSSSSSSSSNFYALVDGKYVPKDMPCAAESIIKGDLKEYCIAAASIIAKVTRDRLMREYANDELYKVYNLAQHKGYPTKEHIEAIYKYGPSSIHRKTFQPIKGMLLQG